MTTRPATTLAPSAARPAFRLPAPVVNAGYFLASLLLLVLIWTLLAALRTDLPRPAVIGAGRCAGQPAASRSAPAAAGSPGSIRH